MKSHLIACHHRAVRDGHTNYAAALAALYLREYGKPMPSLEVTAVKAYLDSAHPFPAKPAKENTPCLK